jgi:hypothetical protein
MLRMAFIAMSCRDLLACFSVSYFFDSLSTAVWRSAN